MSAAIFHGAEHYSRYDDEENYDEDSGDENTAFLLPSSTTADQRRRADQPALPHPGNDDDSDQQRDARPTTMAAANVAFPSPTFDSYVRFPTGSVSSAPPPPLQPQSLSSRLQPSPQISPSTVSKNQSYELERINNAISKRTMSSNEVGASLPNHEGGGGELSSKPVTRADGESMVRVSISTSGDAGCCVTEDMDVTVLEDMISPSNDRSIGSIR